MRTVSLYRTCSAISIDLCSLLPSIWKGLEAELVVNARVAVSPEELEMPVRSCLDVESMSFKANAEILSLRCFVLGRPVPAHRLRR